jgi:uncharacterized protein
MAVNILSLSDVQVGFIYSPQVSVRFPDINLVFGCGDIPNYYLDFAASSLNASLYYVLGNHQFSQTEKDLELHSKPLGGVNVHRKIVLDHGLLIGGIEGCLRYNKGSYQYTQAQMWGHVFSLLPTLLKNRLIFGRYLDIFLSHAPPWGIHDREDLPHQGIKAFSWLLRTFKPLYHFHGHIHAYRPDVVLKSRFFETNVINSYGFAKVELESTPINNPILSLFRQNKH